MSTSLYFNDKKVYSPDSHKCPNWCHMFSCLVFMLCSFQVHILTCKLDCTSHAERVGLCLHLHASMTRKYNVGMVIFIQNCAISVDAWCLIFGT